ncbi:MAG: PAS domain-containing protein [Gammaproteobacteria bacterium]|nr:PAS domain-containing protein [Gammaproteobacteria bacterium]
MKRNLPVTEKERRIKAGGTLVSKTDEKGIITYCNRDFIEISGFSERELIGANHNLVRHPDMPPEAFADLWHTVQSGRPWSGIVKNRCKNGDHYWVKANVTPLTQNGRVTEYMSVRTQPSREEIDKAELLYQAINAKQASLQPTGLSRFLGRLKTLRIKTLLSSTVFLMVAVLSAIGGMVITAAPVAVILIFLAGTALCTLICGLALTAYVTRPLAYAEGKLQQISEGNYFDWIETDRRDEIGSLLNAIKSTQIKLGFDVMDAREQAAEAMAIKTALDNVSSSVMMADPEFNIIYLNKTVEKLFKNAEKDIQQDLPDFDAKKLLGSSIDRFHKNPQHQRRMLEALSDSFQSEFEIGGRTLRVIANPVINGDGCRLGTAVEWSDRTAEVAVEREIDNIVASARAGDLSRRITMEGKVGFFSQLGSGINLLIEVLESAFSDIAAAMSEIAKGDLTKPITGSYQGTFDQVKQDINGTISNLRKIMLELRESGQVINTASDEISAGNNNLSARTEQQASALEETASSMEELTSTVKNNAHNAQQANQLAASARQAAEKGGGVVNRAVQAMDAINGSSRKISEIISVIDEIAFQTNLLALNASVEAARAGEQGRGFAVVATEVRNLAGRSATAAKEIKELIQDSAGKVKTGTELVSESGKTLEEIVSGVKQVGDIISEIAAASQEQSAGIDQVNQAIASMDAVTQQNAALAEQTSAAAASMYEKAREMDGLMSLFTLSDSVAAGSAKTFVTAKSEPAAADRAVKANVSRITGSGRKPAVENENEEWEEF